MDRRVWLLTDARMDAHASAGHPERPARREAMVAGVRDAAGEALEQPPVEAATDAEIRSVHDPRYVAALDDAEAAGGGWLDPDTYLVPGSMLAARLAAGATIGAAFAVADGEADVAVAAVRPPGHHASAARGSGFCLLNNVAIAVGALRATGRAQRIGIVDWDVHHGDGTQELFDADPDVIYASTHQHPFYPGTGLPSEAGIGAARGTKHNHPLMAGAGDDDFVAAWADELLPAIERFAPDALLVSAGYDAHRADPLANLEVTEAGFGEVARRLGELSARLGLNGVALTFEGGYDLDAVRASAAATVRGVLDGRLARPDRA
ncbi:MAG TPA: histone deacetylase [Candidatus Limnocylindria bacterium]|nr:histone deacetylase [Candidatus Limnocylindria bacterium]